MFVFLTQEQAGERQEALYAETARQELEIIGDSALLAEAVDDWVASAGLPQMRDWAKALSDVRKGYNGSIQTVIARAIDRYAEKRALEEIARQDCEAEQARAEAKAERRHLREMAY